MRIGNLWLSIIILAAAAAPFLLLSNRGLKSVDSGEMISLSPSLIRGYTYEIVKLPEKAPTGEDMYKGRFYQGHVFYQDENGEFKKVDTRLSFNEEVRRWEQKKASYNVSLPEYSDGEIDFRDLFEGKDQTISMRPVASHVKGELVTEGEYADRAVRYKNAFEEGVDLLLFANNENLDKLVVINEKPEVLPEETTFDFEIKIPSGAKTFETKNLITALSGRTVAGNEVLIGTGPTENESTILKRFRVWDSTGEGEYISVRFYEKEGKLYLQKVLPKEFLEAAVYPVYTDTTITVFAGAGDGRVSNRPGAGNSWSTAHDATTGNVANTGGAAGTFVGVREFGTGANDYGIDRIFYPFDTSAIPVAATISAATLNLFMDNVFDEDNDGNDFSVIVQTTQPDHTTLTTADFDLCGAVDNPTEGSGRIDAGSVTDGTYVTYTLNSTGLGWIKKSGESPSCGNTNGITCLGVREGHDALDDPIANDSRVHFNFRASETTGTSQDPYLEITYSVGANPATGPGNVKTNIKGGTTIKGGVNLK